MINILVSYYEKDSKLNNYFFECGKDILSYIDTTLKSNDKFNIVKIENDNCCPIYISDTISSLNGQKFIFIGYSHGNTESLVYDGIAFVEKDTNDHIFSNSLFYSNACLCAIGLGNSLIKKGCNTFIGYQKVSYAVIDYIDISIKCENSAIKQFLSGVAIIDAFNNMLNLFDDEVYQLMLKNAHIAAALLADNRDSLVLYGKDQITLSDYRI